MVSDWIGPKYDRDSYYFTVVRLSVTTKKSHRLQYKLQMQTNFVICKLAYNGVVMPVNYNVLEFDKIIC